MKRYTDRDFVNIMEEVEKQGGRYIPETCVSEEYEFAGVDGRVTRMIGNDCEEDALFLVAYDPDGTVEVPTPTLIPDTRHGAPQGRMTQKLDDRGRGMWTVETVLREKPLPADGPERQVARVCANDDLMREWPRFRHVIKDPDPQFGGR